MALFQLVLFFVTNSLLQATWGQDICDHLSIIGGHRIGITDAPYMAGILQGENFACGGSIIHEQFILTAASCTMDETTQTVLVGTARLQKGGERFNVQKTLCHANYNPVNHENDICLLKLSKAVRIGRKIQIAQLPNSDFIVPNGALANVTGWGSTDSAGNNFPARLQQTVVPVVSDACCLKLVPDMTDTMMCAGSRGHDSCTGDAGGPLIYKNVQIGVVSFGDDEGCGVNPGFYTRVSEFVTWIDTTIAYNM